MKQKMGDETDHQSVRQLSQDEKIDTADHAQVAAMSNKPNSSGSVSPPPKEWVKFEDEGGASTSEKSTPEKGSTNNSINKSSQVSHTYYDQVL